jgi:Icc protein
MAIPDREIRLVQITDTHLFADPSQRMRGLDTAQTLRQVVTHVRRHYADAAACLLTGDLSHDGQAGSYRLLQEILGALKMPLLALPGNHDNKTLMAQMLDDRRWRYCPVFDIGPWRILNLDSVVEDAEHGCLDDAQLELTRKALDSPRRHALVCLHHPPLAIGSRWLDRIGLTNCAEFLEAVDHSGGVRGVLWGHIHQEFSERRNGVSLWGTPSTCVQFVPRVDRFAVDSRAPGYRVLDLRKDGTLGSHVERVGD